MSTPAPDHVLNVQGAGREYRVVAPFHRTDVIQKKLAETGRPYEEEMLRAITPLLSADSCFVDVGANIGNHTLYVATQTGCKVVAFEPNAELCDALESSLELNDLTGAVTVRRSGVGAAPGHAEFADSMPTNLGGQSLALLDDGTIPVTTLDAELPPDIKISVIKIDVEGMELDVLQGARGVIERDSPHLFVECGTLESFTRTTEYLNDLGYGFVQMYNATPTHHFRPVTGEAEREVMRNAAGLAARLYTVMEAERSSSAALARANLKYRDSVRSVESWRHTSETHARALAAERETAADAQAQLLRRARNAESAFSRVRAEALRLIQENNRERNRSTQLVRDLATARKSLRSATIRAQRANAELKRLRGRKALKLANAVAERQRRVVKAVSRMIERRKPSVPDGAHTPDIAAAFAPTAIFDVTGHPRYRSVSTASQGAGASRQWFRDRETHGRSLRVAAIVDEFSQNGLHPECDLVNLDRTRWREQLDTFDPDILFVESAWRGHEGSWRNALPGVPDDLREIRAWFAQRNIPTVFWNKEDPVHFDTFLPLAAEFDYVFTTDLDRVPSYMRELGHTRVGFLPFASQPRIHHPIETRARKQAVVFAGGYYRRYPQRVRDLGEAIRGASQVFPVEIFDREYGTVIEDYAFPEAFAPYIVGTLAADEIDEAYKGYTAALNMNSVKDSTTMFARRAVELAMSGTPIVSNFSLGVATIFGETVPMSDQARGIEAHLTAIRDDSTHRDRLRTLANRKVLRDHTYGVRLRMISAFVRGDHFSLPRLEAGLIVSAQTVKEFDRLVTLVERQEHVDLCVVLVSDETFVREAATARGWATLDSSAAQRQQVTDLLPQVPVAVLDHSHDYGPEYVESLGLAFLYSDAAWSTKHDHFTLKNGSPHRTNEGSAFTEVALDSVSPARSMAARDTVQGLTVSQLLRPAVGLQPGVPVVSVDPFDFCEGDALSQAAQVTAARSDGLDVGHSITQLLDLVDEYRNDYRQLDTFVAVAAASLPKTTPSGSGVRLVRQGYDTLHLSRFHEGGPVNLWCAGRVSLDQFAEDGRVRLRLESLGALRVGIVARWYGADGKAIAAATRSGNSNVILDVPAGACSVQLGLRVAGTGAANVRYIALQHREPVLVRSPRTAETLVLADAYPSYDDLYRYGFVHSRVREYKARGLGVDVFRYQRADSHTVYEFEGVRVRSGNAEALRGALLSGRYRRVLVHFLSAELWDVLREFRDRLWVTVWVHGAEVQPWWRRSYATDSELEAAKVATVDRLRFWRELIDDLPAKTGFVFVSEYFRWEVTTDLEREIPDSQVTVIHNPIDTELFRYVPKDPSQRTRILSIRPYANPKYANDLAVAAVLDLSKEPWFEDLQFTFVGDGALFDTTLAPLRTFDNVTIRRGYLTHAEIAQAHQSHGVFLVPTRVDAQGVSRDEAMSSGLVPVTSATTAVPEFVSEAEGYLAPAEDHVALADAIRDMYHHPQRFIRKSAASAERVRRQSASGIVISQELDFMMRDLG